MESGQRKLISMLDGMVLGSSANPVSRVLYETRVRLAVFRQNRQVNSAFTRTSPVDRNKIVQGTLFVVSALVVVSLYTYTTSTRTNVEPPVFAISAPPPKTDIFTMTADSEIKPPEKIITPPEQLSPIPTIAEPATPDVLRLPPPDFEMPSINSDSEYIFAVDKHRKELLVLVSAGENYKIVRRFDTELGSMRGDKQKRGDLRTPEGLYHITLIRKHDTGLPDQYGPRAFVLDYPNLVDKDRGKTGSGIWIHGSGLGDDRKPTEGCVEISDPGIKELEQYVIKTTPVFIFPEKYEIPIKNGFIRKKIITPSALYALKEWYMARAEKPESTSSLHAQN